MEESTGQHAGDAAALQVFAEDNVDTLEESVRVRVYGKDLQLSLLLQADELAPLFSGAAWAGTLLWDAAVHLARRFLSKYRAELASPTNTLRVLELGAGIGVPGMAARVAGAKHVIITEQDELLRLMHVNLTANAEVLRLPSGEEPAAEDPGQGAIVARSLSWGVLETQRYLAQFPDEAVDVVLSCDCIYEPLYGTSWRALAQTMELLCLANRRCVVLMGVERRNEDGVDKFLRFVAAETQLQCRLAEQTLGSSNNRLEVYYLGVALDA